MSDDASQESPARLPQNGWSGAKALGALASRTLEPAARARGFTTMALLKEWPSIAGADLARFTAPEKLIWRQRGHAAEEDGRRPKRPEGATLVLRVDGPRAIEVQYRAQQIMERVNVHFGYRAVVEMRLVQAPVHKAKAEIRPAPPAPDPSVLPESVAFAEDGLKDALIRLGSAIAAKSDEAG